MVTAVDQKPEVPITVWLSVSTICSTAAQVCTITSFAHSQTLANASNWKSTAVTITGAVDRYITTLYTST
jgi:hypothetical protein